MEERILKIVAMCVEVADKAGYLTDAEREAVYGWIALQKSRIERDNLIKESEDLKAQIVNLEQRLKNWEHQ